MLGERRKKYEGAAAVTGRLQYVDDIMLPGMLTMKGLHSKVAHARIRSIDMEAALALPGVECILTWKDLAKNRWGYAGESYVLAEEYVQYVGQTILVVAAADEETALDALELIKVDLEPLPAVFDPYIAMSEGAPLATDKPSNWFKFFGTDDVRKIRRGNIDEAFAKSKWVYEDEFISQFQAHGYIETHVAVSTFDEVGRLMVYSNAQGIDWVHSTLALTLGLPMEQIRVRGGIVGGGFGGKADAGPEILAGLATLRTGKPCKWRWSMYEELHLPVMRGGFNLICKTGVSEDGHILGKHIRTNQDCGAYCYRGNKAIDRHANAAIGPYNIPCYWFDGRVVHTNKTPAAALRGFAVPPGSLASEVSMDRVAHLIGMDPLEFRLLNALRDGDENANGQRVYGTGIRACLEALRPAWGEEIDRHPGEHLFRGRGIGTALMPIGLTGGSGGDAGSVKLMTNGLVVVSIGLTELGQGQRTVFPQLVAEILRIPEEKVAIADADTSTVPAAASPGASQATYVNGNVLLPALREIRGMLIRYGAEHFEVPESRIVLDNGFVCVEGEDRKIDYGALAKRLAARGITLMASSSYATKYVKLDKDGIGFPYEEYAHAACMCQVLIDEETGQMTVERIVSAVDCGHAYNPMMVEGQIEGGAIMNMGMATMENVYPGYPERHHMITNFNDYAMPTTMDSPDVESIVIEVPSVTGPLGAKGPSEIAAAMIAPAIANAVGNAIGIYPTKTPITSEDIYWLLQKKKQEEAPPSD